jgi:RNA methyltransferase, TrmH family
METHITSIHNPLIKRLLKLQQKSGDRKLSKLFIAEGRREVALALRSGHRLQQLLICREFYTADPSYPIAEELEGQPDFAATYISAEVYNKLAYRKDVEGVIMVGWQREDTLLTIQAKENPLILVLEAVEKPGNLGATLRTADAAGVDAILLADPKTDKYNPNVIRASLGCVFSLPVIECTSHEAIGWLKATNAAIFAAALQTQTHYYSADFTKTTALVFGAEDKGLSAIWRNETTQLIKIPMAGTIDSLNVSAAVAVLCFEAVRQRNLPSLHLLPDQKQLTR